MGTALDRSYYHTRNYFRGTGRDSFLVRFLRYYRSRRFHSYCYLHTMHLLLVRLVDQYNILLRTAVDLRIIVFGTNTVTLVLRKQGLHYLPA